MCRSYCMLASSKDTRLQSNCRGLAAAHQCSFNQSSPKTAPGHAQQTATCAGVSDVGLGGYLQKLAAKQEVHMQQSNQDLPGHAQYAGTHVDVGQHCRASKSPSVAGYEAGSPYAAKLCGALLH